MAIISHVTLSGSTSGRMIALTSTALPGTTIHTAAASTGVIDELHLWACNVSTSDRLLTLGIGGTSTADELLFTVPYRDGYYTIVPGLRLEGAVVTYGRASATDVALMIGGYVNRITPST